MTSKKCRRKVINDRDMETPYLLIKDFINGEIISTCTVGMISRCVWQWNTLSE